MRLVSTSSLLLCVLARLAMAAPPEAAVTVAADGREQRFTRADLEALGPTEATWSAHGHAAHVKGVALDKVLEKAGFEPGPTGKDIPKAEKRSGWKKIVVASAPDGFSAVFSCAELMPSMGPTRAMVIWEADGHPLPPDQGPFRIVVLTDGEPSRSIYAVDRLDIVDTRQWPGRKR